MPDEECDVRLKQWFGGMLECVENLSPEERAEFERWDRERPPGVGSSDWPGFAKHLPIPPWESIH